MDIRRTVNDDVENEFRYWMRGLLAALQWGAIAGVASAVLIALLPHADGHPGRDFVRAFWPYMVECAFWLGMFLGMLWSAGKRIGAAFAGSLPWHEAATDRARTGRFFGQFSAFSAMLGISLWLASQVAQSAHLEAMISFVDGLSPLSVASGAAAVVFALVAIACRREPGEAKALLRR